MSSQPPTVIAIDGASGTGKSSTAMLVSQRLNFLYVDTGAHYRAITFSLQNAGVHYANVEGIEKGLISLPLGKLIEGNFADICLDGRRFNDSELRSEVVNREVSYYAAVPSVRQYLLDFQRSMLALAEKNRFGGLVMEGRDIGTNIFPETPYKYFFTTDPAIKAARRAKEGIVDVTATRDLVDSTKGQLKRAADAVVVDTTSRSLDAVVEWLYADVRARLEK